MNEDNFNFEQSFERLEKILDRMNSGKVSLDESLKLYEEADHLIVSCSSRLTAVEKRIEMLIKKRNGELSLDEGPSATGAPLVETFQTYQGTSL